MRCASLLELPAAELPWKICSCSSQMLPETAVPTAPYHLCVQSSQLGFALPIPIVQEQSQPRRAAGGHSSCSAAQRPHSGWHCSAAVAMQRAEAGSKDGSGGGVRPSNGVVEDCVPR